MDERDQDIRNTVRLIGEAATLVDDLLKQPVEKYFELALFMLQEIKDLKSNNRILHQALEGTAKDRDYYRDAYHHLSREKEEKMARGLQYDSGRDMPPGMQVAMARKIIDNEVAALTAALKETDMDCQFCTHAWNEAPCMDLPIDNEIIVAGCEACPNVECVCHTCRNNSQYKWCGAEEANRRLAAIAKAE